MDDSVVRKSREVQEEQLFARSTDQGYSKVADTEYKKLTFSPTASAIRRLAFTCTPW